MYYFSKDECLKIHSSFLGFKTFLASINFYLHPFLSFDLMTSLFLPYNFASAIDQFLHDYVSHKIFLVMMHSPNNEAHYSPYSKVQEILHPRLSRMPI
jgi:hypothetical protein